MVRTFSSFLDFCYLARRNFHTEDTLIEMQAHLDRFHHYRVIFITSGVREDLNPPRQHSLRHYIKLIQDYGALNGLCTSIVESAHIRAVKKPWRRSSHFNALGQMLLTNQRLNMLSASRSDFRERGMLDVSLVESVEEELQTTYRFEHPNNNTRVADDDASVQDDESDLGDEDEDGSDNSQSDLAEDDARSDGEGEGIITSAAMLARYPCKWIQYHI